VHDPAVDHGQHRLQFSDGVVRHALRVEVVLAQHHQIGELARLDRAQLFFLAQEPAVLGRIETQGLHACEQLAGVDQGAV
jgi:hypothetical protein